LWALDFKGARDMGKQWQRQYREPGADWQNVTKDYVLEHLEGSYKDTQVIFDTLEEGVPVRTPFADYRWIEGEGD
jgi:hypothetical protein